MLQSIIRKLHKNEEKSNNKESSRHAGMKVQTNVKSGAEGCQAIICQMDTLMDETQILVDEMYTRT